jgi:hypothetical protein
MNNPRYIRSFSTVLLLLIGTSMLFGGGQNRAGTSAAPELLIPAGGRYLAMGGSPVALSTGVESIFWNPAGLDREERSASAMFSHRTYIADIAYNYFGVGGRFGFGSVGVSLRSLAIGDIPVTTETSPDGTGEIFSPTFFVLGLTYSNKLTDRISIGFTTNIVSETFGQVSASGFAIDAGVQYQNIFDIAGLDIGVAVKNIGPSMKYGGSGLWRQAQAQGTNRGTTLYKVEAAEFEMPSVVELGLAYRVLRDERSSLAVSSSFQNNNYAYDEYRFGAEYAFDRTFFIRGGYLLAAGSSSDQPAIFQDFTVGAGVSFLDVGGTDISLDYAFVPVKYFDSNHVIALRVGF